MEEHSKTLDRITELWKQKWPGDYDEVRGRRRKGGRETGREGGREGEERERQRRKKGRKRGGEWKMSGEREGRQKRRRRRIIFFLSYLQQAWEEKYITLQLVRNT